MNYFKDRQQAGEILAPLLRKYQDNPDVIVLGLPRGGVVVANEIAKALLLPLDITCPRKIGAPHNPEYAIGAITETGEGVFDEEHIRSLGVSKKYITQEINHQKEIAQQRLSAYRGDRPPLNLKDKVVILVDDGLATGATMKAAIKSVSAQHAKKIVVAVPVAPESTYYEIEALVDEIICPFHPTDFYAVGQFYEYFGQTSDQEVVSIMQHFQQNKE
jgi:putative phosphoribosyl transferase